MSVKFNNAPLWITEKALVLLSQFSNGRVITRQVKNKSLLALRINKRWHLLSHNGGKDWQLLPHSDYRNIITQQPEVK